MPSIFIRDRGPLSNNRRGCLWTAIEENNLIVNSIKEIKRNERKTFIVICDENNYELILAPEMKPKFDKYNFDIQTPREFEIKKTVVVKNIDLRIRRKTENEIIEEVEEKNPWAKVEKVITIPGLDHLIKLVFKNCQMSRKALDNGLLMYN